jgi:hypothetical protein
MKLKEQLPALFMGAFAMVMLLSWGVRTAVPSNDSVSPPSAKLLVGTWVLEFIGGEFIDCKDPSLIGNPYPYPYGEIPIRPFESIDTFEEDGTYTGYTIDMANAGGARTRSPEHGIWKRTGPREFCTTSIGHYFSMEDGSVVGVYKVCTTITFDKESNDVCYGKSVGYWDICQPGGPCPDILNLSNLSDPFAVIEMHFVGRRLELMQP